MPYFLCLTPKHNPFNPLPTLVLDLPVSHFHICPFPKRMPLPQRMLLVLPPGQPCSSFTSLTRFQPMALALLSIRPVFAPAFYFHPPDGSWGSVNYCRVKTYLRNKWQISDYPHFMGKWMTSEKNRAWDRCLLSGEGRAELEREFPAGKLHRTHFPYLMILSGDC